MTRLAAVAVAVALVLAGCSSGSDDDRAPTTTAPTGATSAPPDVPTENWDDPQPAEATEVSYPACDVPATFDLADRWAAKAVPADAAGLLGPYPLACEIDGKPAGVIGFLRVFRAAGVDARKAATGMAGTKTAGLRTREFTAPAGAGWEVAFGPADKPERAFAVTLGADTVVIHWSGLDADEHKAGLPAYLLAQASLARRGA
jgi:hypothetical protein